MTVATNTDTITFMHSIILNTSVNLFFGKDAMEELMYTHAAMAYRVK